jgi:hypothetical protein
MLIQEVRMTTFSYKARTLKVQYPNPRRQSAKRYFWALVSTSNFQGHNFRIQSPFGVYSSSLESSNQGLQYCNITSICALDPSHNTLFRASKRPQKFMTQKIPKNHNKTTKMENCFELVEEMGGHQYPLGLMYPFKS